MSRRKYIGAVRAHRGRHTARGQRRQRFIAAYSFGVLICLLLMVGVLLWP